MLIKDTASSFQSKIFILIQKHYPHTGNLDSKTPGDSKNMFLHYEYVFTTPTAGDSNHYQQYYHYHYQYHYNCHYYYFYLLLVVDLLVLHLHLGQLPHKAICRGVGLQQALGQIHCLGAPTGLGPPTQKSISQGSQCGSIQ